MSIRWPSVRGAVRLKFLILLTGILLCFIYAVVHFHKLQYYYNYSSETSKLPTKYVLYWSPFWMFPDYKIGIGYEPFKNCKFKNCFATSDRSLVKLQEFDALLFHASTYDKYKHGAPTTRFPHQKYIFMNLEAPAYFTPNLKPLNSYFNWTMSYRYDSDIVYRHGYFLKEETNYTTPTAETLKQKTKLAAWFASNCQTRGNRELLNKAIQNQMDVDVYGSCGTLQCERKKNDPKLSDPSCYDMVERQYKFYFSFENSYCKDYSTEKLYNILQKNIVPVVYGAGDYQLSAPPNSVINVADFDSVTHLVNYLKYLDEHEEDYLKYFEWKKHYRLTRSLEPCACQLCEKLNEDVRETIYHSLEEWWWGKNREACMVGKDLPKIVSDLL